MEKKKKLEVALVGENGNIFNIMAITAKALKKEGMEKEKKEYMNKVLNCSSYDEALRITMEYVDVV